MKRLTLLGLAGVVACYLLLGGLVFHLMESQQEKDERKRITMIRERFLANHTCVESWELDALVDMVLTAYDMGIIARNQTAPPLRWDYSSSVFFSMTVITTIGYGFHAPSTVYTRMICVIYAIIGIPLFFTFVGGLGQQLNLTWSRLDKHFRRLTARDAKLVSTAMLAGMGTIIFILLPAVVFHKVEDWTYAEALYYTFITLSTVGFGDLIANRDKDHGWMYQWGGTVWTLIGLAWLALMVSSMQELYKLCVHKQEKLYKGLAKRVGGSLANIFDGIQRRDLEKAQAQWGQNNQGADIETETDGQSDEAQEKDSESVVGSEDSRTESVDKNGNTTKDLSPSSDITRRSSTGSLILQHLDEHL